MTVATNPAIQVLRDIPYAEASIGHGTSSPGLRVLTLDVYLPSPDTTTTLRPALVWAHGGAYHRGAKDTDEFEQEGSRNTPVPEYCARYAAKGYVCFSVGYRLTQELPAPQPKPIRQAQTPVNRGRIDHVRQLLGLPPATDAELLQGVEAAITDVASAFLFVHSQATHWKIDPTRIALGGFSAGAFSSIYAAYALGVPAAAVISLSGGIEPEDANHYVQTGLAQPPVLLFSSEFDLPGIHERTLTLARRATQVGLGMRRAFVPGKPHFYDCKTVVIVEEGTLPGQLRQSSLESVLDEFLEQVGLRTE